MNYWLYYSWSRSANLTTQMVAIHSNTVLKMVIMRAVKSYVYWIVIKVLRVMPILQLNIMTNITEFPRRIYGFYFSI